MFYCNKSLFVFKVISVHNVIITRFSSHLLFTVNLKGVFQMVVRNTWVLWCSMPNSENHTLGEKTRSVSALRLPSTQETVFPCDSVQGSRSSLDVTAAGKKNYPRSVELERRWPGLSSGLRLWDLLPFAPRTLRWSWKENRAGIQGGLRKTDVGWWGQLVRSRSWPWEPCSLSTAESHGCCVRFIFKLVYFPGL